MQRLITLHHTHESAIRSANVANYRTKALTFKTPQGAVYLIRTPMQPVIKLYRADGQEISRDSVIFIAKRAPGSKTPVYAGEFTYGPFSDMTSSDQRKDQNRATLDVFLKAAGIINPEGHELIIEIESPDVVDWTKAGTVFEFRAEERN